MNYSVSAIKLKDLGGKKTKPKKKHNTTTNKTSPWCILSLALFSKETCAVISMNYCPFLAGAAGAERAAWLSCQPASVPCPTAAPLPGPHSTSSFPILTRGFIFTNNHTEVQRELRLGGKKKNGEKEPILCEVWLCRIDFCLYLECKDFF